MHYAPLYHVTTPSAAVYIIRDNRMKAGHFKDPVTCDYGVSLTRSWNFASSYMKFNTVILELDQEKLRHHYKLHETNWFEGPEGREIIRKHPDERECEEFIRGDLNKAGDFIVKFHINGNLNHFEAFGDWFRPILYDYRAYHNGKMINEDIYAAAA